MAGKNVCPFFSSLFSLWLVSHPNIFEDVRLPTGEQKKKEKKKKTQKEWERPGRSKSGSFFVCPSPCQKMFVFCCFSFGRLLSPCALVKSRGQLKQQTVGGFVAACCSIRSLLIKGRHESWGQMMWKYLHRACRTKKKKNSPSICAPLKGFHCECHNREPQKGAFLL